MANVEHYGPGTMVKNNITPILQMKKLRRKEVK